jgi:hypothetical protein
MSPWSTSYNPDLLVVTSQLLPCLYDLSVNLLLTWFTTCHLPAVTLIYQFSSWFTSCHLPVVTLDLPSVWPSWAGLPYPQFYMLANNQHSRLQLNCQDNTNYFFNIGPRSLKPWNWVIFSKHEKYFFLKNNNGTFSNLIMIRKSLLSSVACIIKIFWQL